MNNHDTLQQSWTTLLAHRTMLEQWCVPSLLPNARQFSNWALQMAETGSFSDGSAIWQCIVTKLVLWKQWYSTSFPIKFTFSNIKHLLATQVQFLYFSPLPSHSVVIPFSISQERMWFSHTHLVIEVLKADGILCHELLGSLRENPKTKKKPGVSDKRTCHFWYPNSRILQIWIEVPTGHIK